jgi:amino acid transporter
MGRETLLDIRFIVLVVGAVAMLAVVVHLLFSRDTSEWRDGVRWVRFHKSSQASCIMAMMVCAWSLASFWLIGFYPIYPSIALLVLAVAAVLLLVSTLQEREDLRNFERTKATGREAGNG